MCIRDSANSGAVTPSPTPTAPTAPSSAAPTPTDNPFGVVRNSLVDAVIFDGGYGVDYAGFAATVMARLSHGAQATVTPSKKISQELLPRFTNGTPPDVIDNSGADSLALSRILSQLEDLTPVIDARNLEGRTIRDTLYGGVLGPGTFDGKLAAVNYVMTVFAVWYSRSLFTDHGWTIPRTWDDLYNLGVKAKALDLEQQEAEKSLAEALAEKCVSDPHDLAEEAARVGESRQLFDLNAIDLGHQCVDPRW